MRSNGFRARHLVLLAAALVVLLAAGTASGFPSLLRIRKIEPSEPTTTEEPGRESSGEGPRSRVEHSRTCQFYLPDGECGFWIEERYEFDSDERSQREWNTVTRDHRGEEGAEADALDGTTTAGVREGPSSHGTTYTTTCSSVDYDRTYYENNLPRSEEHITDRRSSCREERRRDQSVSALSAGAGSATEAGGAGAGLRSENGKRSSEDHESATSSYRKYDAYYGLPYTEEVSSGEHALDEASERRWRRTTGDGTVFLASPVDGSRIEVLGLRADKGDEEASGSSAGRDSSTNSVRLVGTETSREERTTEQQSSYAAARKWLELTIDLGSGLVRGTIDYERSGATNESRTQENTDLMQGGTQFGGDSSSDTSSQSDLRRAVFTVDAVHGAVSAEFTRWNENTQSEETASETFLPQNVGTTRGRSSQSHTDGMAFGFLTGPGELVLGARYENRSGALRSSGRNIKPPNGAGASTPAAPREPRAPARASSRRKRHRSGRTRSRPAGTRSPRRTPSSRRREGETGPCSTA